MLGRRATATLTLALSMAWPALARAEGAPASSGKVAPGTAPAASAKPPSAAAAPSAKPPSAAAAPSANTPSPGGAPSAKPPSAAAAPSANTPSPGGAQAKPSAAPVSPTPTAAGSAPKGSSGDAGSSVVAATAAPKASGPAKAPPAKPKPVAKKTAKKGKPPRRPSPTAPNGAPKSAPNDAARKRIAGGIPAGAKRDADDPELKALRDADRVLFPKPLPGSTPGFSWDLPKPAGASGTEVVASGLPPAVALDPGLGDDTEVATDAEWIRSLTLPDLPVRLESRVVRYLKFYRDNPKGKAIARVWARKSGRFVPALKAELAKAGLPTDLVWLSLIESGHNPTIVSPAGAAGLWQFMPEAGRLYGLTVDRWVDERFDPKRETEAAILYLSDLHRRFGNWELAMAAYNMGYAGLTRAIRKFNSNDYWELCRYEAGIPWETTLYVPKIFAIAVVMTNKKAFGLDGVTADPPESFDAVVAAPGLPLSEVAAAAGVPLASIESLNAQFLAGRVPPAQSVSRSRFKVRVPAGSAQKVSSALSKIGSPEPDLEPYVVRMGDSLDAIVTASGGDKRSLLRTNHLDEDEVLEAGTVLLVPRHGASAAPKAPDLDVVVISPREFRYPDRERLFYRVRAGDTLGKIAQAFGASKSDLESWNALDPTARLHSGMTLQVWVRPGRDVSNIRAVRERDVRVLVAGSPEFFDHFEGQNGKKRIFVEARAGDTLASVGRRHGMSVGWMERVNRRSRKKELKPGEKLVVYVPVGSAAARAAVAEDTKPEALPEVAMPGPAATPGESAAGSDDEASSAEEQPAAEAPSVPATGG